MKLKVCGLAAMAVLAVTLAFGQRTAREVPQHSVLTPEWKNDPDFEKDVFTFARVRYKVGRYGRGHTSERWAIDFPDSDLNLSYRLQQMTAIKADPNGRVIDITDK